MAKTHALLVLLPCTAWMIAIADSHQVSNQCPSWMRPSTCPSLNEKNCSVCECGSSLGGLVKCNKTTNQVKLLACYCMSQSKQLHKTIVGNCPYSCFREYMTNVPSRLSQLDKFICFDQKRTGPLCGNCIHNHAPAVYSYSMACVKCTKYEGNWVRFVGAAFLPLTLFYFIVIAFRISAVAPKLQCYILISQVVATQSIARYVYALQDRYLHAYDYLKPESKLVQVGISMFSIWNLDFFRSIYHPFCLHPELSSLGVVALDYLIATYPLLLIIITYGSLELYGRYSSIQWLMRPVYKCCFYFRKEWNIKQSLVSVFATFILLSYVKILDTSFNLLLPTNIYDMNGTNIHPSYLYHNGSIEMFSNDHKPFAVLAISMMFLFNFIPLIILYLYPCCCFQKLLNQFSMCNCQTLHILMDTFLSNFRTKPIDCRYFAAIYLTLRIVNLVVFSLTLSRFYYPILPIFLLMMALLVAIFQPYKCSVYNKLDIFFFIITALGYIAATGYGLSPGPTHYNNFFLWMVGATATIPVLYITILIISWATPHRIKHKITLCFKPIMLGRQQQTIDGEFMEATDYQRYQSISLDTDSENTTLQNNAVTNKWYGYPTAY